MEGLQHHISLKRGDVGRYVMLPGDPGRCELIASFLNNARHVAYNREFNTYTGDIGGTPVSVTSTGIGGPSAVIAMEELYKIGADTFIRVGTCGGMQDEVLPGDLVVATASVRAEGTSLEYMPVAFPAAADFFVTSALVSAAKGLGLTSHVGIIQCKDAFYGQHEPERLPAAKMLIYQWEAWKAGGCLASEMESSALFVAASALRARAGTVLLVAGNEEAPESAYEDRPEPDIKDAARAAVEGIRLLIQNDMKGGIL